MHTSLFVNFIATTFTTTHRPRSTHHLLMCRSTNSAVASQRWPRQLSHTLLQRSFAADTPSIKPCPRPRWRSCLPREGPYPRQLRRRHGELESVDCKAEVEKMIEKVRDFEPEGRTQRLRCFSRFASWCNREGILQPQVTSAEGVRRFFICLSSPIPSLPR